MKKTVTILLVLMISFSCVFAYQNTYKLSSDEVQTFLLLRKLSGTMTPDPTYPISANQLASLVKSLDTGKLGKTSLELYNNLLNELEHPEIFFGKDGMGLDVDISILGVQLMKSFEPDTFGILPFKDRMPMGEIKATMYMKDYMAGVFDLAAREKFDFYKPQEGKKLYLSTVADFMNYSEGVPDYAYASVGFDSLNFTIGRDRLESGNGYTGNLELGGNILFDNFAKLSFVGSYISYDFTLDSFEHDSTGLVIDRPDAWKKNIFLHRVSFNIENVVSVSAYEGALVYSQNAFNDIQFLNPFMFMHNTGTYYNADTNNFFGLEVNAVLPLGFQIDGQFFLDQIAISEGDKEMGEGAFAALLNVSKASVIGDGILDAYVEGVYGNPYVYLKNENGYGEIGNNWSNLDLVNDARTDFNNDENERELQYLGYRYGGNLLSIATGAKYIVGDSKFSLDVQYINKGTNGIWSHLNENRMAQEQTAEAKPMNIISFTAGYEQNVLKAIDIQAKIGGTEYINYAHNSGKNLFDFQFSLGVCIHPLEFIKNKASL